MKVKFSEYFFRSETLLQFHLTIIAFGLLILGGSL